MGVEEHYFLAIFASHIKWRHVYVCSWVFTEKATRGFFFFADDEINEETFTHLFGS